MMTGSQSPKKVGEDIAKATQSWKGLKVTVQLKVWKNYRARMRDEFRQGSKPRC